MTNRAEQRAQPPGVPPMPPPRRRCDVYVVLGADPQQRYNTKIAGALRDFLEKVGRGGGRVGACRFG